MDYKKDREITVFILGICIGALMTLLLISAVVILNKI